MSILSKIKSYFSSLSAAEKLELEHYRSVGTAEQVEKAVERATKVISIYKTLGTVTEVREVLIKFEQLIGAIDALNLQDQIRLYLTQQENVTKFKDLQITNLADPDPRHDLVKPYGECYTRADGECLSDNCVHTAKPEDIIPPTEMKEEDWLSHNWSSKTGSIEKMHELSQQEIMSRDIPHHPNFGKKK